MLRSAASKVMWVGRATVFLIGLAVVLALLFGVASTALGANSEPFILGEKNTATALTKLVGNVAGGPALRVVNNETEAGSKGLNITVAEDMRPIVVNATAGKATNLNADELDGMSSMDFYAAGSKVADSSHADQADSATTAESADLLDDKDSSAFQPSYKSTVVVSPVGTDAENGTALLDALSGITDASETNPYLVSIEPGTYDLGTGSLPMQEYVDIRGSGELNTAITSGTSDCGTGTVEGADNVEFRMLTVSNTGTGQCNTAVYSDSASPRLTHVTVEAIGVGELGAENTGVYTTSANVTSANPTLTDVTITASGGTTNWGVYNEHSTLTMIDVTATASGGSDNYGVQNYQGHTTIKESALSGSTNSLFQDDGTVQVADTLLDGPLFHEDGALQCFNNYDENMAAVTCP